MTAAAKIGGFPGGGGGGANFGDSYEAASRHYGGVRLGAPGVISCGDWLTAVARNCALTSEAREEVAVCFYCASEYAPKKHRNCPGCGGTHKAPSRVPASYVPELF